MAVAFIVEPDSEALEGLRPLFRDTGFEVVSASDSLGALTVASQLQPDFIVVRLGPASPDGAELISSLRLIPGFALTFIVCVAADSASTAAMEAGATVVVTSYENLSRLLGFIKAAFAIQAATDPLSDEVH